MGSETSRESSGVAAEPEAQPVKTEGDLKEQPSREPSSDPGEGAVKPHSKEASASWEEVNCFSLPVKELGSRELPENSQKCGQPPSVSQSATLDLGQAKSGQTRESEKAGRTPPQTSRGAAGEPETEPRVILSTNQALSMNSGLQTTAESLQCLAESPMQKKPGEISPSSPAEKGCDPEECDLDNGSFEIITEVRPELAASEMAGECSDAPIALVTERSEARSSVITNKGHAAVDAQTTEGGECQAVSATPEKAGIESPLAQRALDTPKMPLASNAVKHAHKNAKETFMGGVRQNNGGYLTREAMSSGKEHPAAAPRCVPEVGPLPDLLAEPPSKVLQDLDKALALSLGEEVDETCSSPEVIEMVQKQAIKVDECLQTDQPFGDASAQFRHLSCAHKDSTESLAYVRKKEAKLSKTFYFCCSQCSVGDGEANAE